MRVTNSNKLAYSLLKADGEYAVIEAGKTADIDIHPAKVEEYKAKGFQIEAAEGSKADGDKGKAADRKEDAGATAKPSASPKPILDLNPPPAKK